MAVPRRLVSAVAACALVIAACGDDADDVAESTPEGAVADATTDDGADDAGAEESGTADAASDAAPESVPDDGASAGTDEAAPVAAGGSAPPVGSDPHVAEQWWLDAVGARGAWTTATGDGVVVAIVDTGVDLDHPDLVDRLVPGIDVVDGDDVPDDGNGHGTHVAGIAAATADNTVGIAGTAPRARIMPVRVLDDTGAGTDEAIVAGIDWAVANGADVVNLSLGESGLGARLSKGGAINQAIRRAAAADVVVIAAAGNDGSTGRRYRVGVDVIVVNASDPAGSVALFSNTGDARAISAPGVDIVSTAPPEPTTIWPSGTDGYAPLDGTSMAAPVVAGVAALLLDAGVSPADVWDRLAATANPGSGEPALGAGIVDAAAAVG